MRDPVIIGEGFGDSAQETAEHAVPEQAVSKPPVPAQGSTASAAVRETGGRDGPDPTRYGDWEKNGRCIDF